MPLSACTHGKLSFVPSTNATTAGYERVPLTKRIAAATSKVVSKTATIDEEEHASIFPAPLVLPEDELSWEPNYAPQSVRSWQRLETTNKVTPERKTVYLMGAPSFDPKLQFAQQWAQLDSEQGEIDRIAFPKTKDVLEYLQAFYHGLPVKLLETQGMGFIPDIEQDTSTKTKGKKKSKRQEQSPTLWLDTGSSAGGIGIRTRATPNEPYTHQLNLNDLLDVAIEILPADAYALLMIVEHDIYEDDDDDFCCGRAYGASRIAVVSSARYNPALDGDQEVEREHAWPASHCEQYMQSCCGVASTKKKGKKAKPNISTSDEGNSPMQAALKAHMSLPSLDESSTKDSLYGLWLGRVCRTASHELGHCFGMDHCVYYACSMQGTASIIEDARQPPYLCPVDLGKVLKATGADEKERYHALLSFCDKHEASHLFAAFGAWIRRRLEFQR